jgi:hypothetical protein
MKQLLKRFTLRGTSGNSWNFGPETTLFCFVHDHFDFHGVIISPTISGLHNNIANPQSALGGRLAIAQRFIAGMGSYKI